MSGTSIIPGSFATLLAHQGGWDEVLLIGGPMVVIAVLLVVAKRRVDAAANDVASKPD